MTAVDDVLGADEVVVEHPLAFPWDSLPAPPALAPITVTLTDTSLLDLAALEPVLHQLIDGDQLHASDPMVEAFLRNRYGLSAEARTLDERTRFKAIARSRNEILARLEREAEHRGDAFVRETPMDAVLLPTTVAVTVDGFDDFSDFASIVAWVAPTEGSAELTEVWGLRAAPGSPTVGALLAVRIEPVA